MITKGCWRVTKVFLREEAWAHTYIYTQGRALEVGEIANGKYTNQGRRTRSESRWEILRFGAWVEGSDGRSSNFLRTEKAGEGGFGLIQWLAWHMLVLHRIQGKTEMENWRCWGSAVLARHRREEQRWTPPGTPIRYAFLMPPTQWLGDDFLPS